MYVLASLHKYDLLSKVVLVQRLLDWHDQRARAIRASNI